MQRKKEPKKKKNDHDLVLEQEKQDIELALRIEEMERSRHEMNEMIRMTMGEERANDALERPDLLYFIAKIRSFECAIMVDTGAQISIMSRAAMNVLHLTSQLNRNLNGVAAGVGSGRILGKIQDIEVQIGELDVTMSFHVLDQSGILIIFGLDMLKELACMIDIEHNRMFIGGIHGMPVEFLEDYEILEAFRTSLC